MGDFIPKPNTGTLWPNNRKAAPSHPDMRGDIFFDRTFLQDMIDKSEDDLVKIQVSGWAKTIANKECLSLSASAPYVKGDSAQTQSSTPKYQQPIQNAQTEQKAIIEDDDIPF